MFQRCVTWPCFVSMSSSSLWPPVFDTLYLPVGYFSAVLLGPVSSRWVLHLRDHLSLSRFTYVCDFSALCYLALFRLDEFFIFATICLCQSRFTCVIFQCCVTWPCFVWTSSPSSWPSLFVTLYLPVWCFSAVLSGLVPSRCVRHLRDHLPLSHCTCVMFQCCVTWPCFVSMCSSS